MSTFVRAAACLALVIPVAAGAAQDNDQMVRGKYLVEGIVACANCHIARDSKGQPLFDKGMSGGMLFEDKAFKAYAPNITPDPETGIGNWSDAQLAKAIREGIRPNGRLIGPPMPIEFYRNISDSDLAAIVAYIRAQPPVKHSVPKSSYNIPLPPNYGPPVEHVQAPAKSDTVKYGEYLANIGHCMECHTPRDNHGRLVTSRLGAGGQVFPGPDGSKTLSANLTPHESGLKNWTDAQIIHTIRTGIDKDGHHLKPIMAFGWYKNIDDADMKALVAYLRSLKPEPFEEPK